MGNKNKIQIAHILFRDFDIWDPPISSVPQPYQVARLLFSMRYVANIRDPPVRSVPQPYHISPAGLQKSLVCSNHGEKINPIEHTFLFHIV
jgi:hypothetical protein